MNPVTKGLAVHAAHHGRLGARLALVVILLLLAAVRAFIALSWR
jgi:hypothetical protein